MKKQLQNETEKRVKWRVLLNSKKKTCQCVNCGQYISNVWLELFHQLMDSKHSCWATLSTDYPNFLQTTINPSIEIVDRTNNTSVSPEAMMTLSKFSVVTYWWTWNIIRSSVSSWVFLRESTSSEQSFKHTLMQAVTFSSPAPPR